MRMSPAPPAAASICVGPGPGQLNMWVGQPGREPVNGEAREKRERGRQALLSCLGVGRGGHDFKTSFPSLPAASGS